MNYKAVLFDLDGVLIKSMEQHLEAWQHAFSRFGGSVNAQDFYYLEGRGVKKVVETLIDKYQIDPAFKQAIMDDKVDYYNKIFKAEFYNDLFLLLDYLKHKKIPMGVVTGGMRDRVDQIVEEHFKDYFSCVITSDDVNNTKPFPEPYLKCAERLNVDSANCIVIENAPLGIKAAIDAHMTVIGFISTLGKEYLRNAHHICGSFSEIKDLLKTDLL